MQREVLIMMSSLTGLVKIHVMDSVQMIATLVTDWDGGSERSRIHGVPVNAWESAADVEWDGNWLMLTAIADGIGMDKKISRASLQGILYCHKT